MRRVSYAGILVAGVGLLLLLAHPTVVEGKEMVLYVCVWTGLIMIFIPSPMYQMFFQHDKALLTHRLILVGSWVYLMFGAVVSVVHFMSFPSWKAWILPMEPNSWPHPYTYMALFSVPAAIIWYTIVFFPQACAEIKEWDDKH